LLLVLGRIHDIINRGGVKVAPDRIENALMEHPAIAEAVAIGVMDEIGVERIWAAIVARGSAEIEVPKLYEYFRPKLGEILPDRILVVPSIPRNERGKVIRRVLKEQLIALEARETGRPPVRPPPMAAVEPEGTRGIAWTWPNLSRPPGCYLLRPDLRGHDDGEELTWPISPT